jgi:hypothetical protein
MLEKIPDPQWYVRQRVDFIEEMYESKIITLSEASQWLRLIHAVAKKRYDNIINLDK